MLKLPNIRNLRKISLQSLLLSEFLSFSFGFSFKRLDSCMSGFSQLLNPLLSWIYSKLEFPIDDGMDSDGDENDDGDGKNQVDSRFTWM